YWSPFLGGQGPAPAYTARLDEARRARLCERLRATLPTAADGAIDLVARAWAVRGVRPGA
ncbi:MAG TPA: SAM-dependent methyltransferase, partial [Thermodesulfobacteriota bacterium]